MMNIFFVRLNSNQHRCECLACSKTVMGFSIAEHTQSEHQGKDPGFWKVGN